MIRTGLLDQANALRRSTMFDGSAEDPQVRAFPRDQTSSFTATEWE